MKTTMNNPGSIQSYNLNEYDSRPRQRETELVHEPLPYTVSSRPNGMTHDVYLSVNIDEPQKYVGLIMMLRNAGSYDRFNIFLNNGGGMCVTGTQLISALLDTHAYVNMILDTTGMSMTATLLLVANEITIRPNARLMFHHASGGVGGKMHEMVSGALNTDRWMQEVLARHCIPFLDEDEIIRIIRGEDFYLLTNDILDRLPRIGKVSADGWSVISHQTMQMYDASYVIPGTEPTKASPKKPRRASAKKPAAKTPVKSEIVGG